MKQTAKQIKNLFIVQSSISESVEVTARHLSFLARQAYTNRDYSRLTVLADSLINMSARSEAAGRYYQALALSRNGEGEQQELQNTFQQLAENAPLPIRAASILAMGVTAMQKGDYPGATKLVIEANRLALSNSVCAPITAIHAQNALSSILSIKGLHEESLNIMRGIWPRLEVIGKFLPTLYFDYLNNTAYEYFRLGELTRASYTIKKVSASPNFHAHPEWQATAVDIQQAISENQPVRTKVYIRDIAPVNVINIISHLRPSGHREPTNCKADILAFPVPADTFHITLYCQEQSYGLFQFQFHNTEAYHERFIVFVHHLDSISTTESSDFLVRGYISENDPDNYKIERAIDRKNLNKLYNLLNFFEEDLKTLDKSPTLQKAPIDLEQIQKTVKYLMPMLHEQAEVPPLNTCEEPTHLF